MSILTIKTRAKINLTLDVLFKREDGYHQLDMIIQSIDLYDVLTFKPSQKDIIINSNHSEIPIDEKNIVYTAAQLLKKEYNVDEGIEVAIEKNIPISAGLGGGSTNAAGTLKALNKLWGLNLSLEELMKLGKGIGADVPFCLLGGTAVARGIGELLKALPPIPATWLVLVKPPFPVSTAWAYQNIKLANANNNSQKIIDILEKDDFYQAIPYFRNTFEEVLIAVYPEIGTIKEKMVELGAVRALMSGSGPTVFGICRNEEESQLIYEYFKNIYKDVFRVKTYNG